MTGAMEILEAIGAFLVGGAARSGLFVAAAIALAVPALLLALVWRGVNAVRRRAVATADGLEYRRGAFHAPNHTWLAPRGPGELALGIDDVARTLLPSATAVQLLRPGTSFVRGDPIAVVHAGRHQVAIPAPVGGTVVRVNPKVCRDPDLVRREPYGPGWLVAIEPEDGDYMKYPQGAEAKGWLASERDRLGRVMAGELGLAAADGGDLPAPTPGLLGDAGWRKVLLSFLAAA
jgi:glycine cleavage system H lipoate-binding protein